MHPILERQLQELELRDSAPPGPAAWRAFLELVDRTYGTILDSVSGEGFPLSFSPDQMREIFQILHEQRDDRLQAIAEALPDPVYFVDENGCILDMLPHSREHGILHPRSELVGQNVAALNSVSATQVMQNIRRCLETNQLVVARSFIKEDGRVRVVEGRFCPGGIHRHGLRTVVLVVRDLSSITRLDEQERLLATLFEAAHEGILLTDEKFHIIQANEAASTISGYPREQLPGLRANRLFHGQRGLLREIARDLMAHRTWQGEVRGIKRDRTPAPLWITVDALRDKSDGNSHYIIMFSDISALKRTESELAFVASHDPLTGLPNRRQYHADLTAAIARAGRQGGRFALLYMDLNRFKNVNDTLGHHVGDLLLRQIGERLRKVLRSQDQVCRMGGDEFTVISGNIERTEDAAVIAEKVLSIFRRPFQAGDHQLDVDASIGISIYPDDARDPDDLTRQADTAMYAAKENFQGRYQFFTPEMTEKAFLYLTTEMGLQRALKEDELFLVYQPQFNVETQTITGVEALLRWHDPERGDLTAAEFLSIAEATGLINPIGQWVIDRVFQQAAEWHLLGIPPLPLAINLSRRQLCQSDIAAYIGERMQHHALPSPWIAFDVTEGTVFRPKEAALENLRHMAEWGIPFALDDFGSGLSSLRGMRDIPIQRLKIAQFLVQSIGSNGPDEAIIRTILALGNNLGIDVVAEGVETREQRDFLLAEGCREMQGFYFCHPLEQAAMEDYLLRQSSTAC